MVNFGDGKQRSLLVTCPQQVWPKHNSQIGSSHFIQITAIDDLKLITISYSNIKAIMNNKSILHTFWLYE